MPTSKLLLYRDDDGSAPFLVWFLAFPDIAQNKCRVRLGCLAELGHELRRPEADTLRDGIYELRVKAERINYRILYFFHGREVVVLSHGISKQQAVVPPKEIDRAVVRKRAVVAASKKHAYGEWTYAT